MNDRHLYEFVDLSEVEEVCESYITMRNALISSLKLDPTSHGKFIQFCNDQSTLLNNTLGKLDENGLRTILHMVRRGVAPLATEELTEAFIELLMTQIAYLGILRQRKAIQN